MIKLIRCVRAVDGHGEALELVKYLNNIKAPDSDPFFIFYNKPKHNINDTFAVVGRVTENDWANLDLGATFTQLHEEIYI